MPFMRDTEDALMPQTVAPPEPHAGVPQLNSGRASRRWADLGHGVGSGVAAGAADQGASLRAAGEREDERDARGATFMETAMHHADAPPAPHPNPVTGPAPLRPASFPLPRRICCSTGSLLGLTRRRPLTHCCGRTVRLTRLAAFSSGVAFADSCGRSHAGPPL